MREEQREELKAVRHQANDGDPDENECGHRECHREMAGKGERAGNQAEQIAEQDENNTLSLVLTVKPMPSEGGLFASQTAIATGGIGLLLLFVIGMLAFALRRIKEGDTDDWEDEEELDEEEDYEDVIEYHPSETTQANNGIKDGLEWLRENDIDYHRPQGSGSKWERWN